MEEIKELKTFETPEGTYNSFPDKTARTSLAKKLDAPGALKPGMILKVKTVGDDGTVVLEGVEPSAGGELPAAPTFNNLTLETAQAADGDTGVILHPEGTAEAPALTLYGQNGYEPVQINNVAEATDDRSVPNLGQVKALIDGNDSGQNASIPASADLNGTTATFRNATGVALFTLDLSGLGGSATVYGNLVLSAEELTITEGQSGTFTIALDKAPSSNQPVYLAVSDGSRLSVSPATLTFTPENWETPQTVTVTSLEDDDEEDNAITVTLTSTAVDARQVAVAIRDNDVQLEIVTDGLVLNMDYTGHVGYESDTITDLASGVTFKNFSKFKKEDAGITGVGTNSYIYLSSVADSAKEAFMAALKQTGAFSVELFGTKCSNTFFFINNLSKRIITTAAQFGWGADNFAYQNIGTDAQRILQDDTTDNTTIGGELLYTINGKQKRMQYHAGVWPYKGEFVHVVLTFSADGKFGVFLNGVGCDEPITVENFKAWDLDAMFDTVTLIDSNHMAGVTSTQRIYNRVLTADEVTQNMRADAKKLGLETF